MDNNTFIYPTSPPDDTLDVYATYKNAAGELWNGSEIVENSGVRSEFAIAADNIGHGDYLNTVPEGLPAGYYTIEVFVQAGSEADDDDERVMHGPDFWDGRSLGIMNEIIAPVGSTEEES